jgi:hypothetical protein
MLSAEAAGPQVSSAGRAATISAREIGAMVFRFSGYSDKEMKRKRV